MESDALSVFVHVIEDDESVRRGLSRLLRSMGIKSQFYEDAGSFLEQFPDGARSCILMDITMPRMSGLELAVKLKEQGIEAPIIAISARDDEETMKLTQELGVSFYLRKPVDDQALIDAINWVMRSHPPH